MPVKVLAFSGSLRKDSYNTKICRIACEGAKAAGADVTFVELRDLAMPLFDEDLEKAGGTPDSARKFKQLLIAAQGIIIACPEYNSSITGALKNAIDWASRPAPGEPPLVAFKGKVAGLCAASPGALGGLRGLVTVRSILGNLGVILLPQQVAIMKVGDALDENHRLKDPKQQQSLLDLGAAVTATAGKLNA
ncbi:MAG: NAD(P)H-dependent oxidoreductase [Planctomycetota bacterium]